MKKIFFIFLFFIFIINTHAQQSPGQGHSKLNINCATCHKCGIPTKDDLCFVTCPRENMITVYMKAEQTTELVAINEMSDRYGPVYFSHKVHAQMSTMINGCINCHHHNTLEQILKCSKCHETNRKRDDIAVPDLKAAYHRQCMECHKEWNPATGCNFCHLPKEQIKDLSEEEIKKKYIGKSHPPIDEPIKVVYETNVKEGKYVTFYHNDHIKNFKLKCVNCHAEQSCTKCHSTSTSSDKNVKFIKEEQIDIAQHHKRCFTCHEKDKCSKCHNNKVIEPFNHEKSTGWALNKFHKNLPCIDCHGSIQPYNKLDNRCTSCHKNWDKSNFKHSITGLQLTEPHTELNCEDCHLDKNFSNKPSCDNCHENFSYPTKKPGRITLK